MNPPLPDVRQKADHDCGLAMVASVLMRSGWSRKHATDFIATVPCDPWFGTRPEAIDGCLREHFQTLVGEMTIRDLRHFTRTGRPVICAVDDHWIGVDEVTRNHVIYMDPATGTHERKTVRKFEQWWQDRGRFITFRNFGICPWIMGTSAA
jgi:hypothetical protein